MEENQTMKQKKISLATSPYADAIVEIIKDCIPQKPLVAGTEWETIVNSITLDVTSTLVRDLVDRLEAIRQGALHDE